MLVCFILRSSVGYLEKGCSVDILFFCGVVLIKGIL